LKSGGDWRTVHRSQEGIKKFLTVCRLRGIEFYMPTLSEQSKRAEKNLKGFVRIKAGEGGVVFQAQGGRENYKVAQYKTPKEAVAKLWLTLK
jgi:hypothetical protein